ncbi:hypothetical protein CC86DRAFT_413658 [Ophiobolus disseminans]|uniref:DUF6604 domain-containing protein n=1 Tax=Ophiobolus disseminans TaxID=1469910 RepID=A0A6A6ZCD9_9PLEO|nr:hypothetical protein CC86DRAFT_413658 [Ophiobolus disseminans]
MTSMLPNDVYDNYQAYKIGTNIYVTWLVSTSRHITTKGLLACAETIVKKPPKQFEVPLYVAESAARAIRQRTKATAWHLGQTTQDLKEIDGDNYSESNDAHAFFTTTLKRTLELLRPFIQKVRRAKEARTTPVDEITNRFSTLEIEGLADKDISEVNGETVPTPAVTPRITYVVDQGLEDLHFAIVFFLMTFSQIKEVVRTTWHRYAIDGDLDRITAAATSQAAMQLIKNSVHEFTSQFLQVFSMHDFYLGLSWHPNVEKLILKDPRVAPNDDKASPLLSFPNNEAIYGRTRMNPFLSGMIALVVAQAVCELRLVYHNLTGCALAHAHLYNCLRHCRNSNRPQPLLEQEWPDMETFFALAGSSSIFKGDRPYTLALCANCFMLAYKMPLSTLAPTKRATHDPKGAYRGVLKYECIPIINTLFTEGIQSRTFMNPSAKPLLDAIQTTANSRTNKGITPAVYRSPIGILLIFQRLLQREMRALHFIFDFLYTTSARINTRIYEELKLDFSVPGVLSHTFEDNVQVPLVIMMHERAYHLHCMNGLHSDERKVYTKPIQEAAKVIGEYMMQKREETTFGTERLKIQARTGAAELLDGIALDDTAALDDDRPTLVGEGVMKMLDAVSVDGKLDNTAVLDDVWLDDDDKAVLEERVVSVDDGVMRLLDDANAELPDSDDDTELIDDSAELLAEDEVALQEAERADAVTVTIEAEADAVTVTTDAEGAEAVTVTIEAAEAA